jgi:CspA family cold shock protein
LPATTDDNRPVVAEAALSFLCPRNFIKARLRLLTLLEPDRTAIVRGDSFEAKGVCVSKEKGTVKWFNGAKGYGFIQRSTGEDVFVHFSVIQENGYRTLNEGEVVEFELLTGPKGLQAANVVRGHA